jgi:hypothetical protein
MQHLGTYRSLTVTLGCQCTIGGSEGFTVVLFFAMPESQDGDLISLIAKVRPNYTIERAISATVDRLVLRC